MFKREGVVMRETREWMLFVLRLGLGVEDLKRDRVKAVQLILKATVEEPKKINEARNGGFEVVIFGRRSAHKAPTEQDLRKKRMSYGRRMLR